MLHFFHAAGDVPEPSARPGLPDRDPLSGVHIGLSEDRASRLWRDPDHLRSGPAVHRAEGAEVLPHGFPQQGHLLRGRHQPDPRRPRRRLRAAAHDRGRRFHRARRDLDDRHRRVRRMMPTDPLRIPITYVPDQRCIELKALKYYLMDFRNKGIFYEAVTNQILDDLVGACAPRRMTVVGDFTARGGISTIVTAEYVA